MKLTAVQRAERALARRQGELARVAARLEAAQRDGWPEHESTLLRGDVQAAQMKVYTAETKLALERKRAAGPAPEPPRLARVIIRQVSVDCPHCTQSVLNPEGRDNQTMDLFVEPGVVTCSNCKEPIQVPDLSTVFRQVRPLRAS